MNLFEEPVHLGVPIGWGVGSETVGVADSEADCVGRGCSGSRLINFFRLGDRGGEGASHSWSSDMTCQNVGQIRSIGSKLTAGVDYSYPICFRKGIPWLYIVNLINLTWK